MPANNKFTVSIALVLSTLVAVGILRSEELPSPPPGGQSVFGGDVLSSLQLDSSQETGGMTLMAVEDAPHGLFKNVVQIDTRRKPATTWSFQPTLEYPAAVKEKDVIWGTFWARALSTSVESSTASTEFVLELNHAPHSKLSENEAVFGRDWMQFAFTCVARKNYSVGKLHLTWRCGYPPQKIQIGGIQIINYGPSVATASLPHSKKYYVGMEPDAAWRKAADERIEKYRKADLKITVIDARGEVVPDATVSVRQLRHAFGFGSCVTARLLTENSPDAERYREVVKKSYSKVVFENDLKWPVWDESSRGRQKTLQALQWLHDQHILVRGHNLVWPSWSMSPKDLVNLRTDPEKLRQRIEKHIRDEASATKGLLSDWDVVNEPTGNHDILDVLGNGAMVDWFKIAHETDPKPVLFLNDYAGLMQGGDNTPHKDDFEKNLIFLRDNRSFIGGLGIQAHFGSLITAPEKLLAELDRWAALGLDIQITEFDFNTDDAEFQARYTRDFMTVVFSHPAVSALLTWGFWEKAHWYPNAAFYRTDWSITPNGTAWNDLVLKKWHTDFTGQSGRDGNVALRGFLGDYEITVRQNGKTKTVPVMLGKGGSQLAVKLD